MIFKQFSSRISIQFKTPRHRGRFLSVSLIDTLSSFSFFLFFFSFVNNARNEVIIFENLICYRRQRYRCLPFRLSTASGREPSITIQIFPRIWKAVSRENSRNTSLRGRWGKRGMLYIRSAKHPARVQCKIPVSRSYTRALLDFFPRSLKIPSPPPGLLFLQQFFSDVIRNAATKFIGTQGQRGKWSPGFLRDLPCRFEREREREMEAMTEASIKSKFTIPTRNVSTLVFFANLSINSMFS